MDPASAIIGIASFGFVVFGKVNDLRKAIKDAPDRVQALQDSCIVVTLLLSKLRLQASGRHNALSCSPEGDRYLQTLCKKANVCLTDVNAAVKKVRVASGGNINGRARKLRLRWRKWITRKGKLDDLEKKMMELRKALCEMLHFLHTASLDHIAGRVDHIAGRVDYTADQADHIVGRADHIAGQVDHIAGRVNDIAGQVVTTSTSAHRQFEQLVSSNSDRHRRIEARIVTLDREFERRSDQTSHQLNSITQMLDSIQSRFSRPTADTEHKTSWLAHDMLDAEMADSDKTRPCRFNESAGGSARLVDALSKLASEYEPFARAIYARLSTNRVFFFFCPHVMMCRARLRSLVARTSDVADALSISGERSSKKAGYPLARAAFGCRTSKNADTSDKQPSGVFGGDG